MKKFVSVIMLAVLALSVIFVSSCSSVEDKILEVAEEGKIKFVDENANVLLGGEHIRRAYGIQGADEYAVEVEFTEEGRKQFAKATAANVGKTVYILIGSDIVSAPSITQEINEPTCVITGDFSRDDVDKMVNAINKGLGLEIE